jgi:hypothetical protein
MRECAEVRIRWLPSDAGGRMASVPVQSDGRTFYRPHFRVGVDGEYLGVQFIAGDPPVVAPGEDGSSIVELLYIATGVNYGPLVPGAEFEVLEGAKVVGRGVVKRRFSAS